VPRQNACFSATLKGMLTFGKIVVAVDFSELSLAAVRHACLLAGDAPVRLLHVVDAKKTARRELPAAESDATAVLGELARDLSSNGSRVTTEITKGRPADEIVAASREASLVVTGAHARGLGELRLGSVAEEVAARSSAPVLVVREGAEGGRIARVLLALDAKEPSLEAIEAASDLSFRAGVALEVVHAATGEVGTAERDASLVVERALGRAPGHVHALVGSPVDVIVKAARRDDVIVCGTRGAGMRGSFHHGSKARAIVRGAPCPVLVVRRISS